MDTLLVERNNRLFLANTAHVVRSREDVTEDFAAAADWDFDHKTGSPFIKWISGDFVEADNPNQNKQFWTKDDLAMGEYSIKYAPLNMLHKQRQPVGFFAATKTISLSDDDKAARLDKNLKKPAKGLHRFIHPKHLSAHTTFSYYGGSNACVACGATDADGDHDGSVAATSSASAPASSGSGATATAALEGKGSAKIEALSGMWSHIFPFESAIIDQADEAGALFYSMEVRGTHVHCAGPNGCDKSFDYMKSEDHCSHIKERSSIRHIVNPTFRGGALIIPPVKPGWASAHANVYEQAIRDEASRYAELTEVAYKQISEGGSEVSPAAWEHLMATVISMSER
jgi:hypothetical protein